MEAARKNTRTLGPPLWDRFSQRVVDNREKGKLRDPREKEKKLSSRTALELE